MLLATHVVTDVECIANQVLLMNKGQAGALGHARRSSSPPSRARRWRSCARRRRSSDYQQQYGFGSLFQRQEGQVLRLIGDELPAEFAPVADPA